MVDRLSEFDAELVKRTRAAIRSSQELLARSAKALPAHRLVEPDGQPRDGGDAEETRREASPPCPGSQRIG